jgi:hypothetical protein
MREDVVAFMHEVSIQKEEEMPLYKVPVAVFVGAESQSQAMSTAEKILSEACEGYFMHWGPVEELPPVQEAKIRKIMESIARKTA